MDNNTLGSRLAHARTKAKLTQAEVAKRLNVSAQAVSQWERDENAPDIFKLPELSDLYGISTDRLLKGEMPAESMIEITKNLSDRLFDETKMYTFIKGFATARQLYQTVSVLPYVRDKHKGQTRYGKDKVPYVNHPLLITCHALALGLCDDDLLSAALLHDVSEDCGVPVDELPVNDATKKAVKLLTKDEDVRRKTRAQAERYYKAISANRIASIVKLLDRCNNISGMAAAFSQEKMAGYIRETEDYIYPLMDTTSVRFPEYANQVFLIKYHMMSVIEAIRHELARDLG